MRTISVLGFLLCAALGAHDMYIMPGSFHPAKGTTITAGFHVGDSFPESEVGGRVDRLQNPRLLWDGGSASFTNLRVNGKRDVGDVMVGGSGELIAAVNTLPSLITLEPEKFAAYLKDEGLTEVVSWRGQHGESGKAGKERYSKYAKSIVLSGDSTGFASHPVGFVIEIIPESDPYKLKPGDLLPIQVLFRGRPAADLQIESAWARAGERKTIMVGRTSVEGRLKIPLPNAGSWRIHTIRMERCTESSIADWESFWASLTFELR